MTALLGTFSHHYTEAGSLSAKLAGFCFGNDFAMNNFDSGAR